MNDPDYMLIYNKARAVPEEAKKPITAGRLKGMTDINPMYRIKTLTEIFGPCGVGWWYEITNKQIIDDTITNQRAAFVDILLYYLDPFSGEPSQGIPGTGGASFVTQERNGAYLSDECFKMALTDALSVACKALGVAADVYWAKDRTKYTAPEEAPQEPAQPAPQPAPKAQPKPTNTGSAQLATPEQKAMLRNVINLEQLAACNKMYGEDWGTMTANACAAMYNKATKGAANGAAH